MPKVASDPAAVRPLRSEQAAARSAGKPQGKFENLLETEQAPPRAQPSPRAARPEHSEPARRANRPDTPPGQERAKATPETPDAPTAAAAEAAQPPAETAITLDTTVASAEEFAVLAEAIVLPEAETEATEDTEDTEAAAAPATTGEESGEAQPIAPAVVVTAELPASVATALPTLAPAEASAVPEGESPEIVPLDAEAAAPAAPNVPKPELRLEPVEADAAPAKPAPETPKGEAAPKPAAAAQEKAEQPVERAASTPVEQPVTPPAEPEQRPVVAAKSDRPKAEAREVKASDKPAPRETAAPAAAPVAEPPAEKSVKPTVAQAPAAEPATHALPSEAPSESTPAPAAQAPLTIGPTSSTAPVPFHLAAQPILPTVSPLTALRLEPSADKAVPIAGLAVEIVVRAEAGAKRFEIRLDPPELGRIDVRLDVDQAGKVTSRLVVERAETLDLLRRDAPQLERALQHAGLDTEGGLEFSLRDQSFNRDQQRDGGQQSRLIIAEDEPAASEAARRGYGRMIGLGGGVDIRI